MRSDILQPYLFESLDWFHCGMTTCDAMEPGDERMQLAADAPALAELEGDVAVVVGEQVHGARVLTIGDEENDIETPEPGEVVELPETDALATLKPNIMLGVFTADCVPVTIVDERNRALAVAHAGRAGTLLGIVPKTIERLVELGSDPKDMMAWVGPSIGSDYYEVSPEMASDFLDHFSHFPGAVCGPENRHLALGITNWCELIAAGVPMERVELDARCTFESPELFFSYRRDPEVQGRMLTFACVRG